MNSELYYQIKCKPEEGYCLHVGNCTVSGEGKEPYRIIDENGCTKEPSLFEHVQVIILVVSFKFYKKKPRNPSIFNRFW